MNGYLRRLSETCQFSSNRLFLSSCMTEILLDTDRLDLSCMKLQIRVSLLSYTPFCFPFRHKVDLYLKYVQIVMRGRFAADLIDEQSLEGGIHADL